MEKPKVLVVDDDFSFAEYAKLLLEKMGFTAVLLFEGDMASETAASEKPALILMDMNMKHVTGTEAIQKLKSDPATEKIPVLLCSISRTRAEVQDAMDAGAADFIPKPLKPVELAQKIQKALKP